MPDLREPSGEGLSAMQAMLRNLEHLAYRGMQAFQMVPRTEPGDRQQTYSRMRDLRDSSPFSVPSDDLLAVMDSTEPRQSAAAQIYPQVQENFWAPGAVAFRSTRQPNLIVDEWFDRTGGMTHRVTTEISDRHGGVWREVITEEFYTEEQAFGSLALPTRLLTRRETRVEQHGHNMQNVNYQRHPSHQHWEIHMGDPGFCCVNVGHTVLTFPLVRVSINTFSSGIALVEFTVPAAQLRSRPISCLRLQEGDIFGGIVEYVRHRDRQVEEIDFTLMLHPESFQMSARQGEVVRYIFDVPTARYRQNLTPEELPTQTDSCYQLLERVGLLPDRAEALEERRQERSSKGLGIPAICADCRNFHGAMYVGAQGSNFLVCGIHPYGNGEQCSDFEGK